MKNKTFSLRRLGLMSKYNLVSYGKPYMIYYGAVLGISLIIFFLSAMSGNIGNEFFGSWLNTMVIFTAIAIPGMSFRELRSKTAATTFLTLPSSTLEKYLASFLLTTIGGYLVILVVFVIFNLLAIVIGQFMNISLGFFSFWKWHDFINVTLGYLAIHSLFFFGATTFKKSPILQTMLWSTLIIFAISLVIGFIAKYLILNQMHYNNINFMTFDNVGDRLENGIKTAGKIVTTLTVLLLWASAYFKVKEKEVV